MCFGFNNFAYIFFIFLKGKHCSFYSLFIRFVDLKCNYISLKLISIFIRWCKIYRLPMLIHPDPIQLSCHKFLNALWLHSISNWKSIQWILLLVRFLHVRTFCSLSLPLWLSELYISTKPKFDCDSMHFHRWASLYY